ncbi:MAG: mechanosensitive ion channel family protein [Flavobacterium sp.]
MDTFNKWQEMTQAAFIKIGEQLSSGIMNVIGALLVLFIGWMITKFIVFLLRKVLTASGANKLTEKLGNTEWFKNSFKIDVTYIVTTFVKWILYLIFIVIAADIMQWTIISNEITGVFNYLPNLFIAIALFLVGVYIADFIKKALQGVLGSLKLTGAGIISNIAFYLIIIIFTITALNQASIDTSIITNNLIIIISGVVLILVISFGVGAIETVQKLLLSHYTRKDFNVNDTVKFGNQTGVIKAINSTTVSIQVGDNKKICVPIREFTSQTIEIIND